jgi:hypothetical protein
MAHGQQLRDATKNLAQFTKQLAKETQEELNRLHGLVKQQNEVIGACIRLLGQDDVQAALDEMRAEARQKLLEQQIAGVKAMVEKKVLLPVEVVEQAGFIVGTDKLADGTERRVQFEMAGVNPEFQPLYLGKKVGEVIEGANGAKLTITEVYRVDQAAADALLAPPEKEKPAADGSTGRSRDRSHDRGSRRRQGAGDRGHHEVTGQQRR